MWSNKYFLLAVFLSSGVFFSVASAALAETVTPIYNLDGVASVGAGQNDTQTPLTTTVEKDYVTASKDKEVASDTSADAGECGSSGGQTTFCNPIEYDTVSGVVGALLDNLRGIIATIAILFIVIGGMMYILSAGDEKKITTAKNTITSALIGLAIALAAPTLLKEIQNILGGTSGTNSDEISGAPDLSDIVMKTLDLLLSITGILAMIALVIGGVFYMTAYGDDKRIETGKKIITSAAIGIVVVMAALVIVRQIATLMGVS